MNIDQLQKRLQEKNVRKDAYSLKGGLPNEAFCIGIYNGSWQVYYSERGNKTNLKEFKNEEDACKYFYDLIISDSNVFS